MRTRFQTGWRATRQHAGIAALALLSACGGGGTEIEAAPAARVEAATAPLARHAARAWRRQGVTAIAASSDGKLLAVAQADGSVRVLDADTRVERTTLQDTNAGAVAGLVFLADAHTLVAVHRDSTVRLWNAATGSPGPVLHGHEQPLRAVAASADGALIATGGDETRVLLWDGSTGRLRRVLTGATDFANGLSVSRDGRWVASAGADGQVRVWNAATGKLVAALRGHADEALAAAFSPDATLLASAGADGKVLLWRFPAGGAPRILRAGGAAALSLAFDADGGVVVAGSADGRVTGWATTAAGTSQQVTAGASPVNALVFSVLAQRELLVGDATGGVSSLGVAVGASR